MRVHAYLHRKEGDQSNAEYLLPALPNRAVNADA